MASRAIAFVAILIFLFLGVAAINAQHQTSLKEAGNETTIDNETWDVNPGNVTKLSQSDRKNVLYNETVDVFQNGTEFAEEGNYTWFDENGTIKALIGTQLNDTNDANVTYTFWEATDTQSLLAMIGALPIKIGGEILVIAVFAIVLLAAMLVARGGI